MPAKVFMVFGEPRRITEPAEKIEKLNNLVDALYPGRSAVLRPITDIEVKQSVVLSLPIEEASAKVRTGLPVDDEEDYELPIWAGVVPVTTQIGAPIPDPRNLDGVEMPGHEAVRPAGIDMPVVATTLIGVSAALAGDPNGPERRAAPERATATAPNTTLRLDFSIDFLVPPAGSPDPDD